MAWKVFRGAVLVVLMVHLSSCGASNAVTTDNSMEHIATAASLELPSTTTPTTAPQQATTTMVATLLPTSTGTPTNMPTSDVATATVGRSAVAATASPRATLRPTAMVTPMKPKPSPIRPEPLDPTSLPASTSGPSSQPATPIHVSATATPITAATSAQTYRSAQGGYAVDYPIGWTVNERVTADNMLITTFMPAGGGIGISIIVQPNEQPLVAAEDPNTRCDAVTIGSLSGLRCFDTIAMTISMTLVGQGKTYRITTSRKGFGSDVFQRLVESFRVSP